MSLILDGKLGGVAVELRNFQLPESESFFFLPKFSGLSPFLPTLVEVS